MKPVKISIPSTTTILSVALIIIFLIELAGAYFLWYKSIETEAVSTIPEGIVRVDLPAYRTVSDLLEDLNDFVPDNRASERDNPFTYQ